MREAKRTTIERLADLAIRWNEAWLLALQLKGDRNACICEVEGDTHDDGTTELPCWKQYTVTETGPEDCESERFAVEEFCVSCQKREEIHLRLRRVIRSRGALMRAMQRCASRAKAEGVQP